MVRKMEKSRENERWIDALSDEDLSFVKRFVLASGSLKELAKSYGVSYTTIRLRLDRLIDKVKVSESLADAGEFERQLRLLYADGKIDMESLKTLLVAYRKEKGE